MGGECASAHNSIGSSDGCLHSVCASGWHGRLHEKLHLCKWWVRAPAACTNGVSNASTCACFLHGTILSLPPPPPPVHKARRLESPAVKVQRLKSNLKPATCLSRHQPHPAQWGLVKTPIWRKPSNQTEILGQGPPSPN